MIEKLTREFVVSIPTTVNRDDHIAKAMYEMVDQNASLLLVLKDDAVVGVIRSVDVLSEIALLLAS